MTQQEKYDPREKYAELESIKKKLDQETDALGARIDPEIKNTVVALNALGVCTTQSCAGHKEEQSGSIAPWVMIGAPNEPKFQFKTQEKIFARYAEEMGITPEQFAHGWPHIDLWEEALDEASKSGETEAQKTWRKESAKLKQQMSGLLEKFYQNRKVSPDVKLVIKDLEDGNFIVHNGGPDYSKHVKISEKKLLGENVLNKQAAYRAEMEAFGKFLLDKFMRG